MSLYKEKTSLRNRMKNTQDVIDELARKIERDRDSIGFNQSLMNYLQGEWQKMEKELQELS